MATLASAASGVRRDDRFFLISAWVMAAVVVAGFSLQFAAGRSTFRAPALLHVHAVVFMGWVAIYVAQAALAATGQRAMHRLLGWIAAFWVAAMVVLGMAVTVAMARRGMTPFFFQPAYFLVMNPVSVLSFAGLTLAAIVLRRRTAWHRRLHFCGLAILLGPALGRLIPLPLLIPYAPYAVFAAVMLFPVAGIAADLRRVGRIHPAWWWGMGAMMAMQIAIDLIAFSPAGPAIHRAVTAGTPGAALAPLDFPPPPPGVLITGGGASI